MEKETLRLVPKDDEEYASRDEAEAAIAGLTPLDKKKLMVIAKYWCKRFGLDNTHFEPEDLLQEAIYRTIKKEGTRKRWKKSVGIVKHLNLAMRNIAGHEVSSLESETVNIGESQKRGIVPSDSDMAYFSSSERSSSDRAVLALDELACIREFFADAENDFKALILKAEGSTEKEIVEELCLDQKEWGAMKKRIQRRLMKYIKRRNEYGET